MQETCLDASPMSTECRPDKLIFDGSGEQTGKNTDFMKNMRRYDINHHDITRIMRKAPPYASFARRSGFVLCFTRKS